MKFIHHLAVSLLAATLSFTVFVWVIAGTLGSPGFWEKAASQSHFYDQLATVLANNLTTEEAVRPAVAQAVNAAYLQQQGESLIPQLFQHYGHGGPTPLLDLSDLPSRLEQAGFPVPAELKAQLAQPQAISPGNAADERLRQAAQLGQALLWLAPLAAGLLALLLVLIMRGRSLLALRQAALGAAISVAFSALIFFVIPHLIGTGLTSASIRAILPAITGLITTICGEIAKQLLFGAAGLAVLVVVLSLAHTGLRLKQRFTKPPQTPPPPAPGSSFNQPGRS